MGFLLELCITEYQFLSWNSLISFFLLLTLKGYKWKPPLRGREGG